jgi:hypothetical protein
MTTTATAVGADLRVCPPSTPGQLRWSWRDWVAILLLAALVSLFFWRILTPNLADRASFPPGDFARQFWAFATFEARELAAGRLPLWNPYTYSGAPFWADIQSAVFYPLSLLTVVLSGPRDFPLFALEVEAIVHFWLAGAFTYLFVRRIIGHRGAALLAGIAFTFGGYLTSYPSQQLAVLEADTWLPLILLCIDAALVDRSPDKPTLRIAHHLLPTLLAGLAWGLTLLAGHPQSAMLVFYAFTAYFVFLALAYRKTVVPPAHPLIRPFASWAIVVLTGLGLSAVSWLPGIEYMQLSVRAAGFYDKMSSGFPLYDPIQILLPGSVSFYSPLYVGILPLLLAVWAALTIRRRETTFWGAFALGACLLSFGGETFLYSPFYLFVPGFSIFRDQERLAFVFSLCMAVLAGYGFQCLSGVRSRESGVGGQVSRLSTPDSLLPTPALRWLTLGSIGLVILFFYGLNNAGWKDSSPFNLLLTRSVWLTMLLALSWGLLRASEGWPDRAHTTLARLHTPLLLAGCLVLVVLDLFTVNWRTNLHPALPETQTAVPAVVQAIRKGGGTGEVFRVYNEYRVYENYGVPFEIEDTWGASPLRPARYDELYRSLRMERVWQLLNVKYVITWRQELYAPSQVIYQEPAGKDVTYVHRLDAPSPRAWLVHRFEEVSDDRALARLDDTAFDPAQTALVLPGTTLRLGQPSAKQVGSVEILGRTPAAMSLRIVNPADGLLVLSEIDYPGWQAYVDGKQTDIIRTDYILRGIAIPAGEHHVEMVFRPATFTWGLLISGAALAVLVIAGLGCWMRRRR